MLHVSAIDLQVSPSYAGHVKEQSLGRRTCATTDASKRAIKPRMNSKQTMIENF
jgi:hypothetical protein